MQPTFQALRAFETHTFNPYQADNTIAVIDALLGDRDYSLWSPLTVSWAGTPRTKRRSIFRRALQAMGRN